MYKELEIVNKQLHKDKSIKEVDSFSFAKNNNSCPITLGEFYLTCKDYPIVFAKDANTKEWFASAMLGFKQNENLFVDEEGKWQKNKYIPAFFRRYPFVYVNNPKTKELILAVDKEFLSDDKKSNRKLFEKDENSDFTKDVISFLNRFQRDSMLTATFVSELEKYELLEEKSLKVTNEQKEQFVINGFYVVNEEKLRNLSEKIKKELCDKNNYPLITAHLISLTNINRLS